MHCMHTKYRVSKKICLLTFSAISKQLRMEIFRNENKNFEDICSMSKLSKLDIWIAISAISIKKNIVLVKIITTILLLIYQLFSSLLGHFPFWSNIFLQTQYIIPLVSQDGGESGSGDGYGFVPYDEREMGSGLLTFDEDYRRYG